MGCGSPPALVEEVLSRGATLGPLDFILYSGDYQRHDVDQVTDDLWGVLRGILAETRDMMASAFPDASLVMLPSVLMGNNDFIPDYFVNVTSERPWKPDAGFPPNPYLSKVAQLWEEHLEPEEFGSFSYGGYLVRTLSPRLSLLVLNTVVYSPHGTTTATDPFGQFAWARLQLQNARATGSVVFVHGHIPPIYDSWGPSPMMKPHFIARFLTLFAEFEDVIAAHLFGHLHSNELRAVPDLPADSPPLIIQASVAPCYNNQPFLTLATYDVAGGSQRVTDLSAQYVDLAASDTEGGARWVPLFDSVLHYLALPSLTNGAVLRLATEMASNDRLWSRYRDAWYKGVPQDSCQAACRATFACLLSDGFAMNNLQRCTGGSAVHFRTMLPLHSGTAD
jgi:hypothetical protein